MIRNRSVKADFIKRGCASSTKQFLLYARKSNKVILAGEPTQGTLDYSNMRKASFSCMPYGLRYATTRIRRLDAGEGIDNQGIQPTDLLSKNTDWVLEVKKSYWKQNKLPSLFNADHINHKR
ncbi:MAG TPA: hypothetical protein VGE06_05135 [Flavisolibacter sp.]